LKEFNQIPNVISREELNENKEKAVPADSMQAIVWNGQKLLRTTIKIETKLNI
jgi:hypothetical protein